MTEPDQFHVVIVGCGFTGLSAAYELAKQNIQVTLVEQEKEIGGLAAAFDVGNEKLDRFYHHWFTNDVEVMTLIQELGLMDQVVINPTNTGIYYANNFFKLSTPWDLLKFSPLPFVDRIRLGLLALKARRVTNWEHLENMSSQEWLIKLGGEKVFKIVWEPLLKGKFGSYANRISAVWIWNKLKLRGGSRGKGGDERLAYYKGGFVSLADAMAAKIIDLGGNIILNFAVNKVEPLGCLWKTITEKETIISNRVIITTALPLAANMIESWADQEYINQLNRVKYIGNICLVLEMNKPLSKTYWLNVNDPNFPFVGVIEHTNFEHPATYDGKHIVYLSKYLPHTDPLYLMNKKEFYDYAFPFLRKMFPELQHDWIDKFYLWRARWSQPIVEKHYSSLIPAEDTQYDGLHLCSMAQIYPEDRGTNYAIRNGRKCGLRIADLIINPS